MRGRPGRRRERAVHHPRNPSCCHRATVAGCTSASASFTPRPPPSQAHPKETVRRAEASIRTREDTQLVSQGKDLEEQVGTRGQA
jgi:hypothetical protein